MNFDQLMKAGLKVGSRVRWKFTNFVSTVKQVDPGAKYANQRLVMDTAPVGYGPLWGSQDDLELLDAIAIRTSGTVKRRDVRPGECFRYAGGAAFSSFWIIELGFHDDGRTAPLPKPAFPIDRSWLHSVGTYSNSWDGSPSYGDLMVELVPRWDDSAASAAAPVAPAAQSLWNGKCGRCGRGTYTGLFQTEHEGGECR